MSTKRERSVTPDNTAATSSPSPSSVRPRAAPAEITAQRIPPLDLSDPRKWLNELDQWCDRNNIHDDWVKYSLIATTTSTPRHIENNEENSTLPPPPGRTVYQVENALSRQIDALQMANAEIRIEIAALRRTADSVDTADTRRRRTTPITNAANGPVDTSLCWYHQTYGTQARLCRSPCRLRRPAPAAP